MAVDFLGREEEELEEDGADVGGLMEGIESEEEDEVGLEEPPLILVIDVKSEGALEARLVDDEGLDEEEELKCGG